MPYWIVVEGERGPKIAHKTLDSAYVEARRIHEQYSESRRVFVLESIGILEPKDMAKNEKGAIN